MQKKTYPQDKHSPYNNNDNDKFIKNCLHDIRNFRTLSPQILSSINNLSSHDRLLILSTYNEVLTYLESIIFNSHS